MVKKICKKARKMKENGMFPVLSENESSDFSIDSFPSSKSSKNSIIRIRKRNQTFLA